MTLPSRSLSVPIEGAPATEPAGALVASGPDAATVVRLDGQRVDLAAAPFTAAREGRQYNSEGLYIHGPKRARPVTAKLANLTLARCPEKPPAPHIARAQAQIKQTRARDAIARRDRFLAGAAGAYVGRNRTPRKAA